MRGGRAEQNHGGEDGNAELEALPGPTYTVDTVLLNSLHLSGHLATVSSASDHPIYALGVLGSTSRRRGQKCTRLCACAIRALSQDNARSPWFTRQSPGNFSGGGGLRISPRGQPGCLSFSG